MKTEAYAKINLILDLTGKLPDGYHAISTVMQTVSLADEVSLEITGGPTVLTCSDPTVPTDERNTAFGAAELFFSRAGIDGGAAIHIKKNIPHEAGLGGGSADAAAVLRMLRLIYPSAVGEKELYDIALEIGADVPFCLKGGTALCLNKGEIMAPLPEFKSFCVIAKPSEGVSTGKAFARFDEAKSLRHPDMTGFLFHAAHGDYDGAFSCASNIFEELTDIKSGGLIKKTLTENGAYFASMSGSGSAYYGLFNDRTYAELTAELLKKTVPFVAVCETTDGRMCPQD